MTPAASKTLRLWVLPDRGADTPAAVREVVTGFARRAPGINVEVSVRTAGALWCSLMRFLKRADAAEDEGGRPDVLELPSHWTSTLAGLGLLEELTEFAQTDLDPWLPELRTHAVLDGASTVYSLPWWMEVRVLFYRADLLRRYGLDPLKALATWDSLRETCREIAGRQGGAGLQPIANSNPREAVSLEDVAAAVWSGGGDFFSKDGEKSLFHREETVQGMRAYLGLPAGRWMPLCGTNGLVRGSLFDGRCVLQFSGRLPRPGAAPAVAGVLAAVEPPKAAVRAGLLTARHLAVLRGTSRPQEASALLRHLAGPAAARYAAAIGAFPCGQDWSSALAETRPDLAPVFERAMAVSRTLPNAAVMGSVERIFDRSMERLIRSILQGSYREEALRQELLYAKAEIDYVLAMRHGEGA